MQTIIDQMGRKVTVPSPPTRIISLVPSQTELLFDLGLEKSIVGITQFCTEPTDRTKNKPKVGGTKYIKPEHIADLKPDLIIGNKEENDRDSILRLEKHYPVWMSDIYTTKDTSNMISTLAHLTNTQRIAKPILFRIAELTEQIQELPHPLQPAAYLIWKNPWMAAGGKTFIHHMLDLAGFKNVWGETHRYPEFTLKQLAAINPAWVLLSSEPYHFRGSDQQAIQQILPEAKVLAVDGTLYSWYGSRIVKGLEEALRMRHFLLGKTS